MASGSGSLVAALDGQMDREKIERVIVGQKEALARFEKTNEMLGQCAVLSAARLEMAKKEMSAQAQTIRDIKADLDSIFRRIRAFKRSLALSYPHAFAAASLSSLHTLDDDDDHASPSALHS